MTERVAKNSAFFFLIVLCTILIIQKVKSNVVLYKKKFVFGVFGET